MEYSTVLILDRTSANVDGVQQTFVRVACLDISGRALQMAQDHPCNLPGPFAEVQAKLNPTTPHSLQLWLLSAEDPDTVRRAVLELDMMTCEVVTAPTQMCPSAASPRPTLSVPVARGQEMVYITESLRVSVS